MSQSSLIMPFIDPSNNFCHGFEVGQLWQKMDNGEQIESRPVHLANQDQIELMCDILGYIATFKEIDDTWIYFSASCFDTNSLS